MAKALTYKDHLKKGADLVTARENTRAGFISLALEKNYLAVPKVNKNVDLCLLNGTAEELLVKGLGSKKSIHRDYKRYIALGELKGGIDPAGADEHWKTANSALSRIRTSFKKLKISPFTFFVGAAIENSMADEIFGQLKKGELHNAANLTEDNQLTSLCDWLIHQ